MDLRKYVGKYLVPSQVLSYDYKYYSHAAGKNSPAVLSILVGVVPSDYRTYEYSLFIHLDSAGKILKIERLINGYLIKRFPADIDTKTTDILEKVVQLSTGAKTCDFSILRDRYEEGEQIRTRDDLR